MPAVSETRTSMSEEAFELINDFYGGVNSVVRQLAEEIAVGEGSYLPEDPGVVAIERRHVQQAGNQVAGALKSLLKNNQLPVAAKDLLKGQAECVEAT